MLVGGKSKDEYYLGKDGAGSFTYITRRDSNFQNKWEKSYPISLITNSPIVNNQETKLYFSIKTLLTVAELDCSSGGIVKVMQINGITYYLDYMKLLITSDDSNIYFTVMKSGSNISSVCKIIIDATMFPRELLLISDTDVYTTAGLNLPQKASILKIRFNFDSYSTKWIQTLSSNTPSEYQLTSSSLYSSATNSILSLAVLGITQSAILFQFDASDGSTTSSSYALNTLVASVTRMILIGDLLYFVVISTTSTKSTKAYKFENSVNVYNIGLSSDFSRFIFVGSMNSYPYISKIKPDHFQYDTYLSVIDLQMVVKNTYEFELQSSPNLITSGGLYTLPIYSPNSITLSLTNTFSSDISLNCDTISSSVVISNIASTVLIDLSCSISGSESIAYQLSTSSGSPAPSWISFDAAKRILIVNTEKVSAGTTYSFIIKSTNTNYPI